LACVISIARPLRLAEVMPVSLRPVKVVEKAWPATAHRIANVLGIGTSSIVGAGGGGGGEGKARVETVTERLDSIDQPVAFRALTVKL
jgi:hypothetical protein